MKYVSLILVAGGVGTRFGGPVPKQYVPLLGKPLALYSFEFFLTLPEINEIIVVADTAYQKIFSSKEKPVLFADGGKRRQDSVFSGLQKVNPKADIVCTHDSARPFPQKSSVLALLRDADEMGAATLAIPVTSTIKECDQKRKVLKTLKREVFWDIQTPQAIKRDLFVKAFDEAKKNDWEVTDDVSLIERMGLPVVVTPGAKETFKVTTPFDLALAETTLLQCKKNTN